MNITHARRAIVTAVLAGLPFMAAAQDAPPDPPAATPRTADAAATDADPPAKTSAATDLDAVIVTVERREQDLQKYAGTAQAISQEDLKALGINNELRNVQTVVPGLSISNQEGNVEIFIRGVGSANNTELGDPGAAPHVNGNYIARPRGLGSMFYDLERVEINKGPQGTLRGRNALAGTLNIVTKKPNLEETEGYVQAEIGNRDRRQGEFALNMPLGGWAAIRIAGYHVEQDSSFVNAGRAQLDPAGIQDETAGRLSFLYQADTPLSVFAMVDFGTERGTGYPGANIYSAACGSAVSCPDGPGLSPDDVDLRKIVYRGPQGVLDSTNWGAQTTVTYDFGNVTLEYNGSYRDVDYRQTNASSDGIFWDGRNIEQVSAANPGGVDYDNYSSNYWQTLSQSQTHELRLSSSDDQRFRWTTGGFYFNEDQEVGFLSLVDKGNFYSGTEFTMPEVNGRSGALFADGTFDVSDGFRVKGGVRYTEEQKSRYGIGGNWTFGWGADDGGCCFLTRLGTPGFYPALTDRPNFDVTGIDSNPEYAKFLLEGLLRDGINDTARTQLGGIVDGSMPNGTCIDRPDIGGDTLDCPANGQHSFVVLGIPAQQRGKSKFNFTDWRLGFEYDVAEDNLVYGTVSTGHKAGGFNDSFDINEIPETFDPESIIAYEIGSKNSFRMFDRTSTFNVSAFYYDYSDQVFQDLAVIAQTPDGQASGFALVNRNVGSSKIMGVEAESALRFSHGVTMQFNALYLDTEIKKGVVADVRSQNFGAGGITSTIDLSGNELPLSSKFTFNARLQHAIDFANGTFDWQILAAYRSKFYLTQYNLRDVVFVSDTAGTVARVESAAQAGFPDQQKAEVTLNAGLGFTTLDGAWRFEAFGSNLLDNDVSQKALVGSGINVRFLNDARAYGARVRYAF